MTWKARWAISEFRPDGVVLKRHRQLRALAYDQILSAERSPRPWGLSLHVRGTLQPVRIRCVGDRRRHIEDELRRLGVRVVDEYGAMINPTLADFEEELAREPKRLRQSSDNA